MSARFSLSLVGVVGVLVAVLADGALWLAMSDPVTTATAVDAAAQGDVSPIVKALAARSTTRSRDIMKYSLDAVRSAGTGRASARPSS
jgi:hypothetical protein